MSHRINKNKSKTSNSNDSKGNLRQFTQHEGHFSLVR